MSKFPLTVFAMALIGGAYASSVTAADVGISINIGEPGFYGRLDIGDFPQPPVIYNEPMLIERSLGYGPRAPIYLRVPPGHEKHWRKYCSQYDACGQPVYFVQDRWYQQTYAPHYRERDRGSRQGDHQDKGKDKGEGKDQGKHGDKHHGDNHD